MHHRAHQRQDRINGRQRSDNAEPEDAPGLAHTKRIEQESFEPEAFVLRRSMPWADEDGEGLVLVAFGHDLRAYGAQSGRMVGLEDGVPDALFRFAHPIPGGLLLVSSCARRPLRSRCAWCGWWSPGMVSRQVRKGTQATRLIEAHAGALRSGQMTSLRVTIRPCSSPIRACRRGAHHLAHSGSTPIDSVYGP